MQRTTSSEDRNSARESRLKDLLLLGVAGDEAAYGAFLGELSMHLRGYLRRRMGRYPDDVEDLVQESLLAVHIQRHTFDAGQPLTAWVHAIAKYKLVDQMRRRGRQDAPGADLGDDIDMLAAPVDNADEARRDLSKLLDQLPGRQSLPIIHVKVQGLSVAQTAKMIGMSESAVKVGIHRGLKALAAKVRQDR